MTTVVQAPGKLFLAGEYAVTLPGQASILFAIDRFMTVSIEDQSATRINLVSDKLGELKLDLTDLSAEDQDDAWQLTIETIKVFATLLKLKQKDLTGLKIQLKSDLDIDGKKIGLGSSAALVVALLKGMAQHFSVALSPLLLFKLAAIVMTNIPEFKKGSMGDVAAASFGGVIYYQRFDNRWLEAQLMVNHVDVATLLEMDWPELVIHHINFPKHWQLVVGWTGEPADTQKQLSVNQRTAIIYKERLAGKTTPLIKLLAANIEKADYIGLRTNMRLNQMALLKFADIMHLKYMTPKLRALLAVAYHHNIAAKISGAGNGDNGLAIVCRDTDRTMLEERWQALKITPLAVNIAEIQMEDLY